MVDSKAALRDPSLTDLELERHNEEIQLHRDLWEQKPALRQAYKRFHSAIAQRLSWVPGETLELGSGIGTIKDTIPDCVTSDLFPNPWLDRTENAYQLSVEDGSLANLILFDVFHHLEFPGDAMKEFRRALAPEGRLLIFEPAMSPLGQLVYGLLHPEPLGYGKPVKWTSPDSGREEKYFAAQAQATRVFLNKEVSDWEDEWILVAARQLVSMQYFASGGFKSSSPVPENLRTAVAAADQALELFSNLLAARTLLVLELK